MNDRGFRRRAWYATVHVFRCRSVTGRMATETKAGVLNARRNDNSDNRTRENDRRLQAPPSLPVLRTSGVRASGIHGTELSGRTDGRGYGSRPCSVTGRPPRGRPCGRAESKRVPGGVSDGGGGGCGDPVTGPVGSCAAAVVRQSRETLSFSTRGARDHGGRRQTPARANDAQTPARVWR